MDDSNSWNCSVCTYRNSAEAFKCLMCDVRKGTSTRKPRINPEMVAKQVARQQEQIKQQALKSVVKPRSSNSDRSSRKIDDMNGNSNSSIASSNPNSPSANGYQCSSPEPPTANADPHYFDNIGKPNTTASGSKAPIPSSSRNSFKTDSDDEVDENEHVDGHDQATSTVRNGGNHNNKVINNNRKGKLLNPKAKLKNVNRSNAQSRKVTVNNVTVIITEFSVIKNQRRLSEVTSNQIKNEKGESKKSSSAKETSAKNSGKEKKMNGELKKTPGKSGNNKSTKQEDSTLITPSPVNKKRSSNASESNNEHHNNNGHHGYTQKKIATGGDNH
ncbi:hypothetical protein RDWZM_005284 [Blomia tropicalis]|uniref:RanBP2-type domain-containing protein n=1 Tax=Blomia tropicalis TaxID=40697 RepID=A0A9Q0M5U9_BLOTA|nr:YY1-associated factor 2 [Blomia tropicalis]KAJ6219472.1 hypothetical protein RDWZM_005284 [Blomia tropicalis]